jgi:hypothetical protein
MGISHEHNLRAPLPQQRPYGVRVTMPPSDPLRNLLGGDWEKVHWFATREERDAAIREMSSRYVYFRPGDRPSLEFTTIDP